MATRGDGGNCRMCGRYVSPGSGVGWGFTLHPSSNDEVFCSSECLKKAKAERAKFFGCIFKMFKIPFVLVKKMIWNKYCVTIFTAGMSYFCWKALNGLYNPTPRKMRNAEDDD